MKPLINVVNLRGKYVVEFTIGVQTFTLEYGGTKAEADWQKRMLKKAFSNLTKKQ